jgi:Lon protease-like protein
MKSVLFGGLIVSACACVAPVASAADGPANPAPKGTICYSNNITLEEDRTLISCRGLGRFKSLAELFEHGYRVVTSGFVPNPTNGGNTAAMYFVIEERK